MSTRFKLTLGFVVILLANAALYVGLFISPAGQTAEASLVVFLIVVTATSLATLALLLLVTHMLLRPIERVHEMCRRVIDGDLSARVGIRPPGEMGVLCAAIDQMAEAVAQREAKLQRTAQHQIGQTEKLASIGRLASGIAHEINNPLQGVLTFASLLQQKEGRDEEEKEDLAIIVRETTRVRDIVRGLLDFARQSAPTKEPLAINEVVKETIQLVRSQKESGTIVIVDNLDESLPAILGDKNQLEQVFLNLSFNAVEAMQEGGTLSITTSARDEEVVVSVSDTGCGIEEEHLDKIFEPFFTTKPAGKGTGLGLSVSYGTVQQHGGRLEVESEVGRGTTFTVVLPVDRGEQGH
jgi:two-component system NtrC family sensor kinase